MKVKSMVKSERTQPIALQCFCVTCGDQMYAELVRSSGEDQWLAWCDDCLQMWLVEWA